MLVGVQMSITFDLEFVTLAGALGMSKEEVERLWDGGKLKERLDENKDTYEILELCCDLDYYGGVNVGSAYH